MKRWALYIYTAVYLPFAVTVVFSLLWRYVNSGIPLSISFELMLIPTCLFVLGWWSWAQMEPVNLKDTLLSVTVVLVILAILYAIMAMIFPWLQIVPYTGGY